MAPDVTNAAGSAGRHDRVLDALGVQIVSGEILPGTLLDPVELESAHDVSRSVVREVLRSLGSRGLVRATSGRGTFVTARQEWSLLDPMVLRWRYEGRHDLGFLLQLTELRQTIEPTAARLAAERRSDFDVAELAQAVEDMATSATEAQHVDADIRFHRAVLFSTRNELFENMSAVIDIGLRARDSFVHNAIDFHADAAMEDVVQRHRDVLDAIRAGRPRIAEKAMRLVLDRSAADVARVQYASDPALESAPTTQPGP